MMDGVKWIGSPNHYNGREGHHVTHITLHIMAGYLAGTDSVFTNPASQASAHYGIGADGTIHQYVREADGSYSDANYISNNSTISIEHEGGIPQATCTQACIDASARLCADIAQRYGLGRLWHDGTNGNIWLHREISGTDHATCPDLAPNGLPYQQVIDKANAILEGKTNNNNKRSENMAEMLFNNTDTGKVYYWNILTGVKYIGVPDQLEILKAAGVPMHETSSKGPWMTRAQEITDNTLAGITATVNAQAAAIETLSKSLGVNPDIIAKTVQDAVKTKLDSLKITVTDR